MSFSLCCGQYFAQMEPGLEVIKLEFILRLKIKRNDGCLRTRVRKQPIIALYFESELVLKFYNLEARYRPQTCKCKKGTDWLKRWVEAQHNIFKL